jgi:hypothetical protein
MKLEYLPIYGLRKTGILILLVLSAFFAAAGAGGNRNGENKMNSTAISEITYHFGDASVPPDYHRSYRITVTSEKVRIVVNSYGEILADRTYKITPGQFDDLKASLEKHKIANCSLTDDDGCTGGTSERISCADKENEIFSGSVYHCGGKDSGNLDGDITGFADDAKKLVPDLEHLLR